MTFLAVVSSPLPSSHVVYPVIFLNSATKNYFYSVSPSWIVSLGRGSTQSPLPPSDATEQKTLLPARAYLEGYVPMSPQWPQIMVNTVRMVILLNGHTLIDRKYFTRSYTGHS